MRLILFRHGIAVDRADPTCPPDPDRPLTAKGVRRTAAAAAGLARLEEPPDVVLTSPYLRARQTAEIATRLTGGPAPRVTSALEPGAPPSGVLELAHDIGASTVLCAGHAPNLDEVLAAALDRPGAFTQLKKAGAAAVEVGPAGGVLLWMLPPRVLRALGDGDG